jgi:cell division protein FtsQ
MFSKAKRKNRRLRRGSVLQVKVRASKLRAARARMAARILSAIFCLVLAGYLAWYGGQKALDWLVYRNPAFAIQRIDLQTDGVILPERLRHWAGVAIGDNLYALDLRAVRRRLELNPRVKSVSLDRIAPHTLSIRVVERDPIARVLTDQVSRDGKLQPYPFLIDAEGYVMLPLDPRDRSVPPSPSDILPVLSGINPNMVQPGRRIGAAPAQAALHLIAAFDSSPMAGLVEIATIEVAAPDVLTLTTTEGSRVTFALDGLGQQLRRWREIFDCSRRAGKVVATLDLAVGDSIPCCLLQASTLVPEVHRIRSPLHHRKRHV